MTWKGNTLEKINGFKLNPNTVEYEWRINVDLNRLYNGQNLQDFVK